MNGQLCDHTSVGILVVRDGRLLLIERRRPPIGFAPPSGHVDDNPSFIEAARRELQEEVGLAGTDLVVVAEGRKTNPCRREGGTWHYWKIYVASEEDCNELALSDTEARSARWCDLDELIRLQIKTEAFLKEEITNEEWTESPGLEPVWAEWLQQIGVLPSTGSQDKSAEAIEYAWNWFSYHAGQRQAVFRFFVILIGALLAGYIGMRGDGDAVGAFILGLLIVIVSILFWRLDMRSRILVKIAERSLKVSEAQLASALGREEIRLAREADEEPKAGPRGKMRFFDKYAYSFRQVYKIIFLSGIVLGIVLMALAVFGLKLGAHDPAQPAPPSASQPGAPQ